MLEVTCPTCDTIERILLSRNPLFRQVASQYIESPEWDSSKERIGKELGKIAKKKLSPYQRRYKAAFKDLKSKFQTKKGKWLKNGFKRLVAAAHKEAKR